MIKIARIAVTLGLLSSLGAQAYAAGLVVNDNDLRNDLAWLSDRGVIHLSLSTWPLSQEEIFRALKKAKPSYSSEQVVLARINQRLSALMWYTNANNSDSDDVGASAGIEIPFSL